jgi:AAA+ superfamily predicted ATPase
MYISGIPYEELGCGYADQWDLMQDFFTLLNYRLFLYYKYHQWVGPSNDLKNMLGLVVSREEFEHKLSSASQTGLIERVSGEEAERIELGEETFSVRLASTAGPVRILEMFERFDLDDFESKCVMLSYAALLDGKYERLFAYLQDDISKKPAAAAFAVQLYLPKDGGMERYISMFSRPTPFTSLFDEEALSGGLLRLRAYVSDYLSGGEVSPPGGVAVYDGAVQAPPGELVTGLETAQRLDAVLASEWEGGLSLRVSGPEGSGKRYQIKHLMGRLGAKCVFADISAAGTDVAAFVRNASFLARLLGAYLCFYGLEPREPETEGAARANTAAVDAISRLEPYRDVVFILSEKRFHGRFGRASVDIEIEPAAPDGRLRLFERYLDGVPLGEDVSLREVASKFRFEPLQIKNAAEQVSAEIKLGAPFVDSETLHRICYMQVTHNLDATATRMAPDYTLDDITLPPAQKELLRRACSHVKHSHRVYQEWRFGEKIGYGRGMSMLFSGAPGTGKTMCARIMARRLNMEAYKINISRVVSKYIGETEKNLDAIFREARSSNCILFFDECDAIFGKRSEVKDSHDRNANIEVAYLLQQIEEHDGVCILATNLSDNIDAAFMRRITFVVHFPFPNAAERRAIYTKLLPDGMETDSDINWDYIAEKFSLSGGYIKNIVLSAAFMAADEDRPMCMRHLLVSAVDELRKQGIVVVREEFGEYADMIFK